MIRKAIPSDGDSDDERVTYDDEIIGGSQQFQKPEVETKLPASKHRNLFQNRKLKADLDNDFEESETEPRSHWNDSIEVSKGLDFDLNTFQSKVPPKVASKSVKVVESAAINQQPLIKIQSKDIASDRPDHWKSTIIPKTKVVDSRRATALPEAKRLKSRGGVAIPAPVRSAAPGAASRALSFSFQPSWMQATAAASSSSSSSRRSSLENSIVEDISEDISELYSGQGRNLRTAMEDSDWNQNHHETFTAPNNDAGFSSATPTVSGGGGGMMLTPQRTPGMGIGYSQAGGGGGAAGLNSSGGGGSGRKHSTKARPGTIKAKYQKVMRDADAGENRMLSIPPTQVAVARTNSAPLAGIVVDLQDPRTRARLLVDLEVVQLLPERNTAPFRGVKAVVLFTHLVIKKSIAVSPSTTPSGVRTVTGIACEGEVDGASAGALAEGVSDAIAVEGHNRVTPPEDHHGPDVARKDTALDEAVSESALTEGVQCTVLFKPSTCSGSGRMLREGLTLRIYDPEVMRGGVERTTKHDGVILICTQCWEPVSGYTAINSL